MNVSFADRKRTEQTLLRLEMIVEQIHEGVAAVDRNGIVHFINPAMVKMHGYHSSKDVIGKPISLFYGDDQMRTDVVPMIEQVKRRGQIQKVIEHRRKDGRVFAAQTTMIRLNNEESVPVGVILLVTDKSAERQTQRALTERIHQLEITNQKLQQHIGSLGTDPLEQLGSIAHQIDQLTAATNGTRSHQGINSHRKVDQAPADPRRGPSQGKDTLKSLAEWAQRLSNRP